MFLNSLRVNAKKVVMMKKENIYVERCLRIKREDAMYTIASLEGVFLSYSLAKRRFLVNQANVLSTIQRILITLNPFSSGSFISTSQ
jgi:hypothetical protein